MKSQIQLQKTIAAISNPIALELTSSNKESLKTFPKNNAVKFKYNTNNKNWHTKRGGKKTRKYANTLNIKFLNYV